MKKIFFHPKICQNTSKKKIHVYIHLWLGQHDALCDPNYVWCDPHTVSWPTQWAVWHGGLGRPGSAGVVH